jgi:hypothetical protein
MADDVPPDVHPGEGIPELPGPLPAMVLEPPPPPKAPPERKRSKTVPIAIGAAILAVILAVVAIAVGGARNPRAQRVHRRQRAWRRQLGSPRSPSPSPSR